MESIGAVDEAIDPDVDLHVPAHRREFSARLLGVIAVGGSLGALARYGISQWLPTTPGHFPWGTLLINLFGCFCIGVLMVLITEVWSAHPLLRPFLGVGVLGGFTTFSTYANEVRGLLRPGLVPVAFGYLGGTVLGAVVAAIGGVWLTRWLVGARR
ncbi:MAG TPA: fluoride efflux transporter CrcB [Pseudonocardiaceae bacterium]|nr:fluoride efflux transporter CrcB [Pseudonocardiaceae bacterium]